MLEELLEFILETAAWAAAGYIGFWALLFVTAVVLGNCAA